MASRLLKGGGFLRWVNERLPLEKAYKTHMSEYYAPRNFNFWYYFGILSMVVLFIQFVSGIWLTMQYTPDAEHAFDSIEYIMRDVSAGWFIRYMHEVGASFFFIVVYLHIFRGLLYGSYKEPRELLWLIGVAIYIVLMMEGFLGYMLPWGNMSYWGAKVVLSLIGAIPYIGESLQVWIQGDYQVSGVTLSRFFALHVTLIPILLIGLVFLHIIALHQVGSNNPEGIEIKLVKNRDGVPLDGIPFHPYYTVHDLIPIVVFLILFFGVIFYYPDGGGYFLEPPNFLPADNLSTPEHIAPVWYYTPFYAMLRAISFDFLGISAKFWGLVVMSGAIGLVAFLPWLDRSPAKSMRYKGWASRIMLALFTISFVTLGVLGAHPSDWMPFWMAPFFTLIYFAYFLGMPFYTSLENSKPVPQRISSGR